MESDEKSKKEDELINIEPVGNKKKAMSSEKASKVKNEGHSNEDCFIKQVGGSKIKGTGKTDVKLSNQNLSLKKVCSRIQFSLYGINSKYWGSTNYEIKEIFDKVIDCLKVFPENFDTYIADKLKYKNLLADKINILHNFLDNEYKKKLFLKKFITNDDEIDYLVFQDNDKWSVFDANDVVNTIVKHSQFETSKSIKPGDFAGLKVLIKCKNNKGRIVNLIENEIRNSGENHYREFLCVCNRDILLNLLKKHINIVCSKKHTHLKLYGSKTILNFKL